MFSSFLQLLFGEFSSLFSYLSPLYDLVKYVSAPSLLSGPKKGQGQGRDAAGEVGVASAGSTSSTGATTVDDNDDDFGSDLFSKPSTYKNFSSSSKTLHQCAVSEFDYDFTSPNPFSWDFQHLVLANQLNSNNPSLNPNGGTNNKQHITKGDIVDENLSANNLGNPTVVGATSVNSISSNNNIKNNDATALNNINTGNSDEVPVSTNLLFNNNNNGLQNNYNNNQNLDGREASEILSQFSASFQNQLKRNELYQIYQKQNQSHHSHEGPSDQLRQGEQRIDLTDIGIQKSICAEEAKDAHISEDEAEFSDDDYDDYLQSSYQPQISSSSTHPPLSHSFVQLNHNPVSYHFDSENEDDDEDRDTVPLDEELMLSFLRRSNDNTLSVYYMNSDLSEGNTVSPHTATSDSVSGSSPTEHANILKREIEPDAAFGKHSKDRSMKVENELINHEQSISSVADLKPNQQLIINNDNNNIEPQKKYRKLAFSSKPSMSLNMKDTSSTVTFNNSSSDGNNTLPPTADFKMNQSLDDLQRSDKLYICPICQTTFKVKGYLTRHRKKHFASKPFQCPYFDPIVDYEEGTDNDMIIHQHGSDCEDEEVSPNGISDCSKSKVPRCHPTGGFSRRDTFKTHLKALHFVYPTGTKSGDRSDKKGRCAACFKEFKTNKEWLETHVMTNQCEGMITKYK